MMKNRALIAFVAPIFALSVAGAQSESPVQPETRPWAHESELGLATVSGNTESESYNFKQKTSYTFSLNQLTLAARYLRTTAEGVESARNWDGSLRYDRMISSRFSAFVAYGLESDPFAGYVQRNNSDVGFKYEIVKTTPTSWFVEAGYRNTYTLFARSAAGRDTVNNILRVYSEVNQAIAATSAFRFWVEYLPAFERLDNYRINLEPSIVSQLNGVFSIKAGYLVKYQSEIFAPTTDRTDRFFTAALVAKL